MEGAWGKVNMRFALVNSTHLTVHIVLSTLVPINYSMIVGVSFYDYMSKLFPIFIKQLLFVFILQNTKLFLQT